MEYNDLPNYYSTIGRVYEKMSLNTPFNLMYTISNTTKSDILLHKKRNIEVVYPGINDRLYQRSEPIYDDFMLCIGRLVFYKNLETLSKSIGVTDNLIFTGHIPHGKKLDLLKRCSALTLPSVFEGFGLVILEGGFGIVDQDVDGFL